MGKFDRWPWRKLYCVEKGPFAGLPLYVRALAAELLKFTDDEGRIWVGTGDPLPSLGRLLGANRSDRRLLAMHVPMLLDDGYLVRDGGYLVIRNQVAAQGQRGGSVPPTNRPRTSNEPTTNRPRTDHEPTTNRPRTSNEAATKVDLTTQNHSGPIAENGHPSRTRVLRIDKRREEGDSPLPQNAPSTLPGEGGNSDLALEGGEGSSDVPPTSRSTEPPALGAAWAQGITRATGRPCTLPGQRWHIEALARSAQVHGPPGDSAEETCTWLAESAGRFAQTAPASLTPERWEAWLNAGGDGAAPDPMAGFEPLPESLLPPPRWGRP